MSEKKLYIGNLSYDLTEEELNTWFTDGGITATSVAIIKDRYTDRSKGFGFVEVETDEDVQKAVETLNGQQLKGRTITVNAARAKEERRDSSSRRPYGGGGGGGSRRPHGGGGGGNRGGGGHQRRS